MFNVFSNKKKASEVILELRHCAGASLTRELIAGPEDEPLYMLKPDVQAWLKWINERILYELPEVKTCKDAQWVGVRIRIATSMLNKIEQSGILSKDVCVTYHDRLVSNVRKILGEIYTEDLPF